MDLLGATNKFLLETNMSDQVITLVDAADDVAQAVHWIAASWVEFQTKRLWKFRWAEGSFSVVQGTTIYDATALGLVDGDVVIRGSSYNASGHIDALTYRELRDLRRSTATPDTSRVTALALEVGPTAHTYPDVGSTQVLSFDYWKAAAEVSADGDLFTGLPTQYQMMIVHLALTNYGSYIAGQEGANTYAHHAGKFAVMYSRWLTFAGEDNQIPVISNSLMG